MTGPGDIADVEAIVLRASHRETEFDPSTETLVVRLTDASGRVGIGEADGPAETVRDLVLMRDAHAWSRGLSGILIGRDPFEARALWAEMYKATIIHARRGLGIHALSAVDVALHDLAGRQLGRPVHSLLGGAVRETLHPYATIYPGLPQGRPLGALLDDIESRTAQALALGYRAVKVEVVFDDLATDRQVVDGIRRCRRLVGDDIALMVDFGYRWSDWRQALSALRMVDDCDLYFAEAVLDHDDLDGHARLAARVSTRLCGAELATTVHECRQWIEQGHVDVLQPEISRCGGLTELARIADLAALHGALVVPHNWKTGINAAATLHLHAARANIPVVEWLSPDLWTSLLRGELTVPEPSLVGGCFGLPTAPGLGVALREDALGRFAVR